jgi:adenylyl-sulfate kinase
MGKSSRSKTGRAKPADIHPPTGKVNLGERERRNGHRGCVVWLTGLSASGKSTVAAALELVLFRRGCQAFMLDGDRVRNALCRDLSFSPNDRQENIRRVGEVAKLFADGGFICIAAFISPYRADREIVRKMMPPGRFTEVFVNAPLAVCEARDPKGLYLKAREHKIKNFTGISAPYEAPLNPEIELRTDQLTVTGAVAKVLRHLEKTCGIRARKK